MQTHVGTVLVLLAVLFAQPVPDAAACADPTSTRAPARPDGSGRTQLFDQFIEPLVDTAMSRRARLADQDPNYVHRIDPDLNTRRINVAMLGYGEEHDQTYDDMGVSVTILSLNLDTWDVASISLSRDIRVPELEDQTAHEPPRWPLTLRAAYRLRGFDGIRPILEDATGLTPDEQKQFAYLADKLRHAEPGQASVYLDPLGELAAKADSYDPIPVDAHLPIPGVSEKAGEIYAGVWPEAANMRRTGELLRLANRIVCPIVAIHGEHDPDPIEGVEAPLAASSRDFQLVVLEKCGHDPWRERWAADKFYETLERQLIS